MSNTNKLIALFITFIGMIHCQPDPYRQGRYLYQSYCENCHMEDGSGLYKLIPSLENSTIVISEPDSLVCLIRHGIEINVSTGQEMPGNTQLNDVELTNLINYLRSLYAIKEEGIKVSEVKDWMATCP